MVTVREGLKIDVAFGVSRTRGSGAITLTSPERRILDANRALVAGFDWAAASWDSVNNELFATFDSTATGLTAVGTYYVQLRGVIGAERPGGEIVVQVVDWGP
jgi:hypothetical protein